MSQRGRIALAEAIGTLILVVGGPGTAILATGGFFDRELGRRARRRDRVRAQPVVRGVRDRIDLGCHINPAVTPDCGRWARPKSGDVPFYMGGQVIGGLVGALIIFVIANSHRRLQREGIRLRVERLRRALAGRVQVCPR